jgi:hypothetical protein
MNQHLSLIRYLIRSKLLEVGTSLPHFFSKISVFDRESFFFLHFYLNIIYYMEDTSDD